MNRIERELKAALTVAELIDELKCFPDDARVLFACDYGDHGHTEQALPVGQAEELDSMGSAKLVESAYSTSGIAIERRDEKDDEDGQQGIEFNVVVLRH